jgi:hypothetical protein
MEAEGTLFIRKAVSRGITTLRIGNERTGTEIGNERIGNERIGNERIGNEQTGTEQTRSEGIWAIGAGRLVSATIHEGRRAQMGNGTLKVSFTEPLRGSNNCFGMPQLDSGGMSYCVPLVSK